MRIRSHLFLMAAVVLIPGFLAAAVAIEKVREGERQAALRGLRETVRATALLVDGEIQRSVGALGALGNSQNLKTGNLAAFYEQAAAIDQPPDVWTLLLDETGTQILNTAVPFGTPPPAPLAGERVAQVLATKRLLVTDLIVGPATGKLVTTVYVPAKASIGKPYVVAQAFSVDHWKSAAMQPRGQSDWIVAVVDRTGKFISRSQKADQLLGRQARPELVAAAAASNEGLIRHKTLEGIDSYDAFTHSALTGWTIAVAAPVETIEASATQAVAWLAGGVATALTVATAMGLLLGRIFIQAMDTASEAARRLGKGEQPATPHTALHEVNALNGALADAGRLIAAERKSRELVEADRIVLLKNETAAREAAQSQNAAKDQFLALLGHELRNPLAAISGAAEALAKGPAEGATPDRFLKIIQRQNRHLAHIVDDLLEVSRLLSGKIVLDSVALDLAECVRNCVDALRASERATDHILVVDAEEVWVHGDPVRMEQIVNNLVANALKYSDSGSEVRVRVRAIGGEARIEVTDFGVGIGPELMPHIFEPFVQGPAARGQQAGGLGIGRALVQQLVGLHGGQVVANSDGAGTGCTFVVTLPRAEAARVEEARKGARSASRCRVLLVEDNADVRESTAELLRIMGYEVAEAGNGDEALIAAADRMPDVIVMDVGLPGRDGYRIATDLRQLPRLRHVPLIAVTGYGQARDKDRASAAGFDAHLVKPVDPELLAQAIENQLARRVAAAS